MYFVLIRYVLCKQFRTICDFTFATSFVANVSFPAVPFYSVIVPSHYTSYTTIHSQKCVWRETHYFSLGKNTYPTLACHEILMWFICNFPYNLLWLFNFAHELESWRKICLVLYTAVAQTWTWQIHLSSSQTQVASEITWRKLKFVVS